MLILTLAFIVWNHRPGKGGLRSIALIPLSGTFILILLPLCHLQYFALLLPSIWLLVASPWHLSPRYALLSIASGLLAYVFLASPTPTLTPVPDWARHGAMRLLTALPLVAANVSAVALAMAIRDQKQSQKSSDKTVDAQVMLPV
jgi:hypothetical protein